MEKDWEPGLHTRAGWGLPDDRPAFADVEGVSEHLKEYLAYYKELKSPGYAVLVTGEWGVGKTYQIKKLFPQGDAYYVSLFGLKCVDDIAAAVYATMYPTSTMINQANKKFGDISIASGSLVFSTAGGLTSSVVSAFLKKRVKNDKPIIFDDLERCGVRSKELLGVINNYVEHHGCNVIAIAHDEKLVSAISEYKEKVFGQTICLNTDASSVYETIVPLHSERELLLEKKPLFLSVFEESGIQSVRVLKQALRSVVRFLACFDSEYFSSNDAFSRLLKEFLAFQFEVISGGMKADDIRMRRTFVVPQEGEERPERKIEVAERKYKNIYLQSAIFSHELLIDMHCNGVFDAERIGSELRESRYFSQVEHSAWRKVISFDELEDDQVQAAVQELESQFQCRELHELGEMLHMFSLRMMLAEYGELDQTLSKIEDDSKQYIDDIRKEKLLPRKDADRHFAHSLSTGSYGYGYWVMDCYKSNFNELLKHLVSAIDEATIESMQDEKDNIIGEIQSENCNLYELICYTADGPNKLYHLPVLRSVEPAEFVDAFLKAPKANWRNIELALKERRSKAMHDETLKYEIDWIQDFAQLLEEEAKKGQGLTRARLLRASKYVLSDR